jgi:ferredoxin
MLTSNGVVLILGGATALAAGQALADRLDVTVLLEPETKAEIPPGLEFPVAFGRAVRASGYFGAYEVVVDGYRAPREGGGFAAARDGAISRCDLILDLSGRDPLFSAPEARDGYFKPAPDAVPAALDAAGDLVGEFEKPRYIDFKANLCAHSRSRIVGCTRCLDVCAMQAITPMGDHVEIDAYVCAGCGNCAAVCPTGAASYTVPTIADLLTRIRTLILASSENGGRAPLLLLHDGYHGAPLLQVADIPPDVLPLEVNEVKQLGLEALTAAMAYGASGVRVLVRKQPKNGASALTGTVAMANALAAALGYGVNSIELVHADTPGELSEALERSPRGVATGTPSSFVPAGEKRGLMEFTLKMLHRAAPSPVDIVPLPVGAPFGTLKVDAENCTLCLACVSVCPTGALAAGENRPALLFLDSACVQCGLCAATCPEDVIALEPRIDFSAWNAPRTTIKEEEPFCCIRCAKPFGTKSSVERVVAKLRGHWMYSGEHARRLDAIKMCEQCRVESAMNEGFDPYEGGARPRPRTAADYIDADRGD